MRDLILSQQFCNLQILAHNLHIQDVREPSCSISPSDSRHSQAVSLQEVCVRGCRLA